VQVLLLLLQLVLLAMKLVFSTKRNAHQDTIARLLPPELRQLLEHTQPKAQMVLPLLTVMMVTLVPLEQSVHLQMLVQTEPTTSTALIALLAQHVLLVHTVTKVNKLPVNLVCTVMLQPHQHGISSALLVLSQRLVLHLQPALSALVDTHATSPVLN